MGYLVIICTTADDSPTLLATHLLAGSLAAISAAALAAHSSTCTSVAVVMARSMCLRAFHTAPEETVRMMNSRVGIH